MWFIAEYSDEDDWNIWLSNKDECLRLIQESENDSLFPCHSNKNIEEIECMNIEVDWPDELHTYEINNVELKIISTGLLIIPQTQ